MRQFVYNAVDIHAGKKRAVSENIMQGKISLCCVNNIVEIFFYLPLCLNFL